MAAAQSFEDMNATPLGKLPMPKMQTKGDAPPIDAGSTSYADILKGLDAEKMAASTAGPAGGVMNLLGGPGQQHQVQQQMQQQPGQQYRQPPQMMQQPRMMPPQQQQQMAYEHMPRTRPRPPPRYALPPRMPRPARPGPPAPAPAPAPERRRQEPADGSLMARLRRYRNPILVGLIVFVMLRWVAPRLGGLPRMSSQVPAYPLSLAGVVVAAALCGGMYRATEYLAPPAAA